VPKLAAGTSLATLYWGFAVSCANSKGDGDRSEAGPFPEPFDGSRCESESETFVRVFDGLQARSPTPERPPSASGYAKAIAASEELAEIAGLGLRSGRPTSNSLPSIQTILLRRMQAIAEITKEAQIKREDVEQAANQATHVALLEHVYETAARIHAPEPLLRWQFESCAKSHPQVTALFDSLPAVRVAMQEMVRDDRDAIVTPADIENAIMRAFPQLEAEKAAAMLLEERRRQAERAEAERRAQEERVRLEEEARKRREIEERLLREAELADLAAEAERAKREAEERARFDAEEAARLAAEERKREEEERIELARRELARRVRMEAEAAERQRVEERLRLEAEEADLEIAEAAARKDTEARWLADSARRDIEERLKSEAEEEDRLTEEAREKRRKEREEQPNGSRQSSKPRHVFQIQGVHAQCLVAGPWMVPRPQLTNWSLVL